MSIKGFRQLERQLKRIQQGAKELEKTTSIPFEELFHSSFMKKYSQFSSFEEFLDAGNFKVESQEDFEAIPDADMDDHVTKTTKFSDWQTMLDTAVSEYVAKKLGF